MAKTNRAEARTAGVQAAGAEKVPSGERKAEAAPPKAAAMEAAAVEMTVETVAVETSKVETVAVKTSVVAVSVTQGGGEPPEPVNHLVITVHGIRTFAQWSGRLKSLLEASKPGIRVEHYNYGYFSAFAFLIPFLRWIEARRFRQALLELVNGCAPGARIDIVAHSFGTFLVAKSLRHLPAGRNIDTIIFAGSVLKSSFPWDDFTQAGRVRRVVNECGLHDQVLVVNQMVALFMGMAGRVGFHGMIGNQVVNRYFPFGHSGYFGTGREDNAFMSERWLPLLTTRTQPVEFDERQNGAAEGAAAFVLNNSEPIKIAGYLALFGIPILLAVNVMKDLESTRVTAENLKTENRLNTEKKVLQDQLTQKAEESSQQMQRSLYVDWLSSTKITDRAPDRVRERLIRDLLLQGGATEEDALDLALPRSDSMSSDAGDKQIQLMKLDAQIKKNKNEEHQLYHVKALVQQQNGDFEPARVSFLAARAGYEENKDQFKRYYAQYLSDFGLLLMSGLREHDQAVEKCQESRRALGGAILGPSKKIDDAFLVDSLCLEASACRWKGRFDQAERCLEEAESLAETLVKDQPHLLRIVLERQAWLYLDLWKVEKANAKFVQAMAILSRQGREDREAAVASFQIRIGEAMTKRLCGDIVAALDMFEEVEGRILKARDKDEFTPRERRMMREYLVFALERRADTELNRGNGKPSYQKASDIYGQAILHAVPLGNLEGRAKLLYKQCIAQILEGQYDEARRTFEEAKVAKSSLLREQAKNISLHQEIAQAAIQLPEKYGQDGRKALRDILAANIKDDLTALKRERVEMLLLASEMLLTPEPSFTGAPKPSDADLVFELMGATIRGSSHPELSDFVGRYNKLANRAMGNPLMSDRPSTSAPAPGQVSGGFRPPSPDERTFFWFRLTPSLTLTLSRGTGDSTPVPSLSGSALASGLGESLAVPLSASGPGETAIHPPGSTDNPGYGGSTRKAAKPVYDHRTGTGRFSGTDPAGREQVSAAR